MKPDMPIIAHVLHQLYLAGAEVLARDLSRRLKDRYEFIFVCLDRVGPLGEQMRSEGFEVIDGQRQPGVDWEVAKTIKRLSRERRIDLLHAHQYTPFFYASVSRGMTPINTRPPVIFTEHGRHYPDERSIKRVWANRLTLLRKRDRVTAVGEFVKRALVNNEGIDPQRIEVIRNGIDPDAFDPGPDRKATRDAVRAELDIPPDATVLLQVARFHPVKDHATALRAFAKAHEQHPEGVMVLAGDGDKRPDMESLAAELNIAPAVRFLGVRDDVDRLMPAADIFVLSSVSEGISVTLLEAMAARLPVVATAVGGNAEVVEHDVTGLLSPRKDHEAMATHMAQLIADPTQRGWFGEAGHARLLDRFTQQQMHAGYERLYQDMLG